MANVQRTMFAAQAMDFAQLFKSLLGPARLQTSAGAYRPELSTPEGESTGGGTQSVQHIRLVPEAPGGATLVMGSVDARQKAAELRSFVNFASVLEARFKGTGPEVDEASYQALMQKVQGLLASQSLQVTIRDGEEPGPARRPAPAPSRSAPADDDDAAVQPASSKGKYLATAVSAAVALAIALAVLMR